MAMLIFSMSTSAFIFMLEQASSIEHDEALLEQLELQQPQPGRSAAAPKGCHLGDLF